MTNRNPFFKIWIFCFLMGGSIARSQAIPISQEQAQKYFDRGEYTRAWQTLVGMLVADPGLENNPEFLIRYARSAQEAGYDSVAALFFNKALQMFNPYTEYIKYFLAKSEIKLKDYRTAEIQLCEMVQNFSNSLAVSEAKRTLAQLYYSQNRLEEANTYWQDLAAQSYSFRCEAYWNLAQNQEKLNHRSDAKDYYLRIIQNFPERRESYDSILRYEKLFPKELGDSTYYAQRARVYFLQKKNDEAVAAYTFLLKKYPHYPNRVTVELNRATASFQAGKFQQTKNYALQLLKRYSNHPSAPEALILIARSNFKLGLTSAGLSNYQQVVDRYPDYIKRDEYQWRVARNQEDFGMKAAAVKTYQKLTEKFPTSFYADEARWRLGFFAYQEKDYPKARTYWGSIVTQARDIDQKARAEFWIAKAQERENLNGSSHEFFKSVSNIHADNYYVALIRKWFNDYHFQKFSIPHYDSPSSAFARENFIARLFGEEFGILEIDRKDWDRSKRDEWENRLQMYESVGAFGTAYRMGYVFDTKFTPADSVVNPFGVTERAYPVYYYDFIHESCIKNRIPEALILSIMKNESSFDDRAISSAGALGLMQIMPETAERLAHKLSIPFQTKQDLLIPDKNIAIGVEYFKELLEHFEGKVELALGAYNAGPTPLTKWVNTYGLNDVDEFIENIEYSETRRYVRKVLKSYLIYETLYPELHSEIESYGYSGN